MHKREKGCPYRFTSSESERERERAMREEAELASPGAAIVARRESRSAMPERLKVAARDDSLRDSSTSRRRCRRTRAHGPDGLRMRVPQLARTHGARATSSVDGWASMALHSDVVEAAGVRSSRAPPSLGRQLKRFFGENAPRR